MLKCNKNELIKKELNSPAGHPNPIYNDVDASRNDMGAFGGPYGNWLVSGVSEKQERRFPDVFVLSQNYPNPFNSKTIIQYQLKNIEKQLVNLTIYNIQGKEVITLVKKMQSAGFYSDIWDGKDNSGNEMNSGVYLGVLKINQVRHVIKMLLGK
ncbi:T9SS type A sorting domain-containing protein [candidate division KSB1 bacterium]|nr:T9SS type A sorting domain-containing protein [candidate division KSB1 bacterium]